MAAIDLVAEVAGTVWKIVAQAGQVVAEDDTVLLVESMKMEIPVCASEGGMLLEILVRESDIVAAGDVVARLQAE